jgi:hypothetical protein
VVYCVVPVEPAPEEPAPVVPAPVVLDPVEPGPMLGVLLGPVPMLEPEPPVELPLPVPGLLPVLMPGDCDMPLGEPAPVGRPVEVVPVVPDGLPGLVPMELPLPVPVVPVVCAHADPATMSATAAVAKMRCMKKAPLLFARGRKRALASAVPANTRAFASVALSRRAAAGRNRGRAL